MRTLRRLAIVAGVIVVTAIVALLAAGRTDRDQAPASFSSVGEMTAASDLVIVGEVVAAEPGRVTPPPVGSELVGTQHLDVTVRVTEVLRGDAGEMITVSWPAWEIDADGSRGASDLAGGQPVPAAGDRDLWFLFRWQPGVWGLVAVEGRFAIGTGVVAARVEAPGAAAALDGMTLDEVRNLLVTS